MDHPGDRPAVYTARGAFDGEDWQAVGDAVNARMAARRIGQQALANASGVSVSTLRQIQHGGRGRRVQNSTLTAVARALGWPDDHLIRVLLSEHPDTEPADGGPTLHDVCDALRRIENRLAAVDDRLAVIEHAVIAPRAPDGES
jgi:transcriptional regulator with XRE-family HTH domain